MSFRDAIIAAGLGIHQPIHEDGKLHRFHVTGDKPGKLNGWYVYYPGQVNTGAFGCWKRNIKESWFEAPKANLTPTARKQLKEAFEQAEELRQQQQREKHNEARLAALKRWREAKQASNTHPYLQSKRVGAFKLKEDKLGRLLIPVIDAKKQLHSLQLIGANGEKRFVGGGKVKGHFYPLSELLPDEPQKIYICEGYATGATIYTIVDAPVICAFFAENLMLVAQSIRKLYPKARIVICADNDQYTIPNVGIIKAQAAARASAAEMVYPKFKMGGPDDRLTDFNDLLLSEGPQAVRESLSFYESTSDKDSGTGLLDLICLEGVKPQPIEWLWPGKLALGKICMIAGEPGLGKSQITIDIASKVSRGWHWPAGTDVSPRGKVIILSAEDDIADTIKPRLLASEADCSQIFAVEGQVDLSKDLERVKALLRIYTDVKLIIIDPITAYMGETDSHNNSEVRALMAQLSALAADYQVCILIVTHLNKDGSKKAINRVMGSIGFVAAVRCAYGVLRDPDNENNRLFLCIKNNIAIDNVGLSYSIMPRHVANGVATSSILWSNEIQRKGIDESMKSGNSEETSAIVDAKEFLELQLRDNEMPFNMLAKAAKQQEISVASLRRAKKQMGIIITRRGYGSGAEFFWQLPA